MAPVIETPYVRVALSLPLSRLFTYEVPAGLKLMVGHAVRVPFGRRTLSGYVIEGLLESDVPNTRPISGLIDESPVIDPERIRFCDWASGYYLAGLGEMIATALPARYRRRSRRVYFPTQAGIERISESPEEASSELQVLRETIMVPGRTATGLARRLDGEVTDKEVRRILKTLEKNGHLLGEEVHGDHASGMVKTIQLCKTDAPPPRGKRMLGVLRRLEELGGKMDLPTLVQQEGNGIYSTLRRLEDQGYVERGTREDRTAFTQLPMNTHHERPQLNPDQSQALSIILSARKQTVLLCGITGSGKTEVYLQAAESRLSQGEQALVLVPEIALTPQLTQRFAERFGDRIAVLHSGLGQRDKLREWRRIRAKEATIAIGARSALFAPFANLGLIVVDEEHDDSYKQDDGVRYHARDLAVVRGRMEGCTVVLGSATPSMESWWNAQTQRYLRVDLPRRATPAPLPEIDLVDIRGQPSGELLHERTRILIDRALTANGKVIVLYNRRGYAPVVECPGCGAHFQCPSCGIGMVLHRARQRLTCHHCGLHRDYRPDCMACGSAFQVLGHGTERVAETLEVEFPGARIFRMDADTTTRRGSHQEILDAFRLSQRSILVGTQVVAKGHDFPDVKAAIVLGVDHILNMPDFRSAERTFSLVTQLAGRAGRDEQGGKVIVQTRHPDHFVFRQLQQGRGIEGLDAFMTAALKLRDTLGHPPLHRLVLIKVEGTNRAKVYERAAELSRALRLSARNAGQHASVVGPVSAPLSRLVGRWRYQVVIRGPRTSGFRTWLQEQKPTLMNAHGKGARVAVDVDPRSLL